MHGYANHQGRQQLGNNVCKGELAKVDQTKCVASAELCWHISKINTHNAVKHMWTQWNTRLKCALCSNTRLGNQKYFMTQRYTIHPWVRCVKTRVWQSKPVQIVCSWVFHVATLHALDEYNKSLPFVICQHRAISGIIDWFRNPLGTLGLIEVC